MTPHDVWSFFRAWTRDPLRVGAIAPSGIALAKIITSEITASAAPVIELGPGTGAFTRALLSRGLREQDLTLVEAGADFASELRRRFPRARLLPIDAAQLGSYDLPGQAGAVVSGLPLLSMAPRKAIAILSGAFCHLRPGGALYQFTYGPGCPVGQRILDLLGLNATRIGRALLNLPPATVYRITRRPCSKLAPGCVSA